MAKNNNEDNELELKKLINRKKEESEALRKMLEKLNTKNNNLKSKK